MRATITDDRLRATVWEGRMDIENGIEMARGEDRVVTAVVKNNAGERENITGGTAELRVRLNTGTSALITKAGTLIAPTKGAITFTLEAADIAALEGTYVYGITYTDAAADPHAIVVAAPFVVTVPA